MQTTGPEPATCPEGPQERERPVPQECDSPPVLTPNSTPPPLDRLMILTTVVSPTPAATPPRGDDVQGCPNTTRPCRLSGSTPWALSRGWEENAAGCDGTGWAGLPCEAPATPPRHINRTLLQHRHT
ncbi:unnamed protein product [Gadus morhua 'NCC']